QDASQRSGFRDPMTLLPFIAACTKHIGLTTAVMVLTQRQTVLVAKQAAAIDVLSGGRLRLGIGVGWNQVEFEQLGLGSSRTEPFLAASEPKLQSTSSRTEPSLAASEPKVQWNFNN